MKNTQKIVAAALASFLILSNTSMLSAYAKDKNTNLGENTYKILENTKDSSNINLDLSSLKVTKNEAHGGERLIVSLNAPSDLSTIGYITIYYTYPGTSFNKTVEVYYNYETNLLEGYLDIENRMESGTWTVDHMNVSDYFGNRTDIYSSDYDFSNISVNVDNSNSDITAPVIDFDSLNIDKKDVKTGGTVKVSLKATDDKSGVDCIYIDYKCSNEYNPKYLYLYYNEETDLYEGTLDINNMENGTWSVDFMYISDKDGNGELIHPTDYDFSNISFNVNNN